MLQGRGPCACVFWNTRKGQDISDLCMCALKSCLQCELWSPLLHSRTATLFYVPLMLHDWNSLLCMGLWKVRLEMGSFVPPLLFSFTSVYGPKPDLLPTIFYNLFAYFITTRMSIYVKITKDNLTHWPWLQPVLDGCTEHDGEDQVRSVLRSRFSSEGSFLKFLSCLIILSPFVEHVQ